MLLNDETEFVNNVLTIHSFELSNVQVEAINSFEHEIKEIIAPNLESISMLQH